MTEHPATDLVARTLRLGEAATTPLPDLQRPAVHALSREADHVNRLTRENRRLRAQLRVVVEIATQYEPPTGDGHAAVFRNHILTIAGDSTDQPIPVGALRRMLADITGDDQALAEISGQGPGGDQ